MKKLYIILILFTIISVQSVKSEQFFDFYFHKIVLDDYPTIKVIGLVQMSYVDDEFHELLNDENLALMENNNSVSGVYFDYLEIVGNKIIFEISYLSTSPKNCDRTVYISEWCSYRQYSFVKSNELSISPEQYDIEPKGFIPLASFMLNEYIDPSPFIERFVLSKQGIDIKKEPNSNAMTLGHISHGETVAVSKEKLGSKYDGQVFEKSVYGYWREVNHKGVRGYILDTYLSYLPARTNHDPLEVFLKKTFGESKPYGKDERQDELVLYGNNVIYNKTHKDDKGYVRFNCLSKQEFYIVAQNWFYNNDKHHINVEESEGSTDHHIELIDDFDFTEYDISNQWLYVGEGRAMHVHELLHSVRFIYSNYNGLKNIIQEVSNCELLYQNVSTSTIAIAKKDSTITVPFKIWKNLYSEDYSYDFFKQDYQIELIAKSKFNASWLLLFRSNAICESHEWLALITSDYDNPSKLIIQGLLPAKNDTVKSISFDNSYCGCYLDYKTDTTQVRDRFYGLSIYGFDKLYEDRELTPSQKAKKFIDEFDFSM